MCEVKIYIETEPPTSKSSFMNQVRKTNKWKKFDEDVDHSSESSDDSVKGIHFDDIE